jgi:hypothetical protein
MAGVGERVPHRTGFGRSGGAFASRSRSVPGRSEVGTVTGVTRRARAVAMVAVVSACLVAGCSDGDSPSPGGSASSSAAADPAEGSAGGSGEPAGAEVDDATVAPQPEPLPPSPASTGAGGGVAGVLRAIRAAGLPAEGPRRDDCRAQPPGLADGCLEILRTDTVTIWRFEDDAAARRYVTDVAGPAGGVARAGYVVEFAPGTPAALRDRYRKALAALG